MRQYEPVKSSLGLVFFSLLFNVVSFLTGENTAAIPDNLQFTGTITFEHVKDVGGTFATDNAQFYTSESQEHVLVVDGESLGTRGADNRVYSYTEDDIEAQNDFETKIRLSFSESELFDVTSTNSIYIYNNGNEAVFSITSNTGQMAGLVSIPGQSGIAVNLTDNNTAISFIDITTNNNFSIYISSLAIENVTTSNAPALDVGDATITFAQGDEPIQISPAGTVSLADETLWDGGSLSAQISTNAKPGDSLSILDDDGDDLAISIDDTDLLANDVVVGSLNVTDGKVDGESLLSVVLNENATNAILQEILQSMRFEEAYGFVQEELREITVVATNGEGIEIKRFKKVELNSYPTFDGCPMGELICPDFSPTSGASSIVDINGTTVLGLSDLTGGFTAPEGSYFKVEKFNGELLINDKAVVKDQNDSISSIDVAKFTPNRGSGQYNIIYGTLYFLTSPDTYFEVPAPARVFADVDNTVLSPTFTHAGNQTVDQNAGATTKLNFITSIDDGDLLSDQEVTFLITENDNTDLFSSVPAISNSGILTYTPKSDTYGKANLTVTMSNEDDQTSTQDFTIYVTPTGLLINEIQPKASADFEFVEIFNNSNETQNLSGLVLVLFNGSNDLAYKDIGLEGTLVGSDYLVIGGEQVPNLDEDWGSTSFQNGTDAVALYVGSTSDFNTSSPPSLDGLVDVIVYGDSDGETLRASFGNAALRAPGDDSNSLSRTVDDSNVFVVQPETPGESNINQAITLTISGLTGLNKVYDRNTATQAEGTAELSGIEEGDDVSLGGTPEFNFSTSDVGTNLEILVTGYLLEGADKDKYELSLPTLTGNITPKELTVSVTANNKVYDKTTTGTVGSAGLSGIESGDVVTIDGSPSAFAFGSDDVGSGVTVTATGTYTLTGTDAGNYTLSQPTLSADITPKELTINVTANNKTYDKTTTGTVGSASLSGVEIGDVVTIDGSPSAFAFASDDVGTGIAFTATGNYTITGTDAGNYTVSQPSGLSADITAKGLTVDVTANNKTYDKTAAATVGSASLSGVESGDVVTIDVSPSAFAFVSDDVGTGIAVTATGNYTITGTDAGNYTVSQPTLSADITAKGLTVDVTANNKTYDKTTAATVGSASLSGVEIGDGVTIDVSPSAFAFVSDDVGTDIVVTATGNYTITGTDVGNYTLSQPTLSADITAKGLTVDVTANSKTYDKTTAATVGSASLSGVEIGDVVTIDVSPSAFAFVSDDVGTDIVVTATGTYTLTGTDAGNYTLTQPSGLSADITAKGLTVDVTANNKTYDKTTIATVGSASLSGIESGDVVTIDGSPSAFAFASDDVGTGIAVIATGTYTITGADVNNYSVTQPSGLSADITPKVLSVIAQADNKTYDGDVTATVSSASLNTDEEVIENDDVSIDESPSAYAFVDSDAGSGKSVVIVEGEFTLSGNDAHNYMVTQPDNLSADIIPKGLTLIVTVNDKVYDGELSTTVDQASIEGLIEGDLVTLSAPNTLDFVDPSVGNDKTVVVDELFSIEGAAASNYFIDDSQSEGSILPKELSITGLVGIDKTYDGSTAASTNGIANLTGLVGEDEVVLDGNPTFIFTSANVADNITITTSGYAISGAEAGNYTIIQPILSADISAKALVIVGITGDNKVYDGGTSASISGSAALTGSVTGDDISISGMPEFTFENKNVGTGIAVTATGDYTLTGADANNYTVLRPTLTADIIAKELTISVAANNKTYDKTTSATVGSASLSGIEGGDVVTIDGSPSAFAFASDDVGTGIVVTATGTYTLTGTDAGNYTVSQPTLSADITAKTLTVTGLTGDNKIFDGNTTASASGTAVLNGVIGADDVILDGVPVYTFVSSSVGTGIVINTSGYFLIGSDAGNYTVTQPTLSGDITEPTVAFALTTSNQSESASTANINVALSSVTAAAVTVNYTVSGTATGSGTDYTLADGTLTINPNSSSEDISISIIDDLLDEFDETVVVTLNNPTGATLGSNTVHTYTINDNDDAPTVQFDIATDGQSENEEAQDLPISISAESGKTVTVDYAVTGTATGSGTDYTLADGTFTFNAGDVGRTFFLTGIVNDLLDEDDETIIITLSNPSNATLGGQQTLTYTIQDDDASPTVILSVGDNTIDEASGTSNITATLSAISGRDVTVNLGYTGTATNGTDYNSTASTSITIPAGQSSANAAIGLTATQDTDGEGNETIIIEITSVVNGTEDGIQQQTITLVDDDDITAPSGYSVTMDDELIGGAETATSTFTFVGAEVGANYNYTVSSDGGGNDVTGTGTIATATDQITLADLSGLVDGTLTLTVALTDPSGNIGTAVTSSTTSKDTTAPNAPMVNSITTDSGSNGTDQITNDNTPDVNGTAEANAMVEVFVDGSSVGTTSADMDGNWTMAYNGNDPITDGELVITATATDEAGNQSSESSALNVIIDTTAPTAPMVISISTDSGANGADQITNDNTLYINGIAEGDATVEVLIDGISIGHTTADSNGNFSFDHTGTELSDASYSLTAKATDIAGNESAESTEFDLTIDTASPEVISIVRKEADQLRTGAEEANFTVIFSEIIIDVDIADFAITLSGTTGVINTVTAIDGKTYEVNVNGISGEGTIGIEVVDDDSILDEVGNPLGGIGADNGNFTAGEIYTTNFAPIDIIDLGCFVENNSIGDVVRELISVDRDTDDHHVYSLVEGIGDADNASFTIDGNQLKAAEIFDFETANSYSIRVKTDDGFGGVFEKALTIDIGNELEPSITIAETETAFDVSALGLSQERTINVTNNGEVLVQVTTAVTSNNFNASPSIFDIEVGETVQITISFVPTEARTYNESFTFIYEGGEVNHPVSGEGAVITSVDQKIDPASISVYPNPADKLLTIDLSKLAVSQIDVEIVNTVGLKIISMSTSTDEVIQLDISSYKSGVYILQFNNGVSMARKKIVIKR
ncbi:YDG domain-containing protein [Roseivirga misakiensis]|nr:YDG domain-containing protein [Roseivirga misakiensis]